jgi:hypothetical protein
MKKLFFAATAFLSSLVMMAQSKVEDVVKFGEEKHDFGKIKQGTPVFYSFEIKNISDKPIVVERSWASCGCTVPEQIVDPIMPGTSAKLKVEYSAAAAGVFTKDVYVKLAGIDQPKNLQIVGEVVAQESFTTQVKEPVKEKPKVTPVVSKPAASTTPTTSGARPKAN